MIVFICIFVTFTPHLELPKNYPPIPVDNSQHQSVSTKDLMSWSLQIARGMKFLESRKVGNFFYIVFFEK